MINKNVDSRSNSLVQPKFARVLGFAGVTSIIIGSAIGSGIFKKPAVMLAQIGSPKVLILIWIVAGLLTLAGALTNAEIGAMIPEEGGQYAYFRRIYGEFLAFIFGWGAVTIIQTGSIASIAYVFGETFNRLVELPRFDLKFENQFLMVLPYLGSFKLLENIGVKLFTIMTVALLTVIHVRGVRKGERFQIIVTGAKVLVMVAIIALGIFGSGDWGHLQESVPMKNPNWLSAIMAALAGAFWAYDGWNNSSFLVGEIREPNRVLPKSLFIGTIVVISIYVAINFAYLHVLSPQEMLGSKIVAIDVVSRVVGPQGVTLIILAIMLSTFGATSGSIMASARIPFAMSRLQLLPSGLGKIHSKFQTPANALYLQLVWAVVLILTGTFDMLTDMLIFVAWIFYGLGAFGVILLRLKEPTALRSYRVPGYPIVPLLFVGFSVAFVLVTLITDVTEYNAGRAPVINSLMGILLLSFGVPVYFFMRRKHRFPN